MLATVHSNTAIPKLRQHTCNAAGAGHIVPCQHHDIQSIGPPGAVSEEAPQDRQPAQPPGRAARAPAALLQGLQRCCAAAPHLVLKCEGPADGNRRPLPWVPSDARSESCDPCHRKILMRQCGRKIVVLLVSSATAASRLQTEDAREQVHFVGETIHLLMADFAARGNNDAALGCYST